jgi:hypothetical protein
LSSLFTCYFAFIFSAISPFAFLPPQCTASIPHGNRFRQAFSAGRRSLPLRHASVPTGHASVPTGQAGLCVGLSGDIVLFLYSERSGNPLGRLFFEQAGSRRAVGSVETYIPVPYILLSIYCLWFRVVFCG